MPRTYRQSRGELYSLTHRYGLKRVAPLRKTLRYHRHRIPHAKTPTELISHRCIISGKMTHMPDYSLMPRQPDRDEPSTAPAQPLEKPPVRRAPVDWQLLRAVQPPALAHVGGGIPSVLRFETMGPAQYVVPRTFGMSAILGIMTALALLFGFFQLYGAHPVFYLFFGVQVVVICVAQMLYGKTPRVASTLSGGLLLPLFVIGWVGFWDRRGAEGALCVLLMSVPLGAFFGYITGTMAAGVFLVMDAAEQFLTGNRSQMT